METDRLLAENFLEGHPADAALALERLSPEEAAAYLNGVPGRLAAESLRRMVASSAAECVAHLSPERLNPVLQALPLNSAAALLRRIDAPLRERLLAQAGADLASWLRRLLRYPEGSAGALMDPRALALPEDITVTEALARVRRAPRHALYYLYVVDRTQKLAGVLNLRELMLATPSNNLSAVIKRQVVSISPLADRTAIGEHPGWREVHALPVVDPDGLFLGALRYETLRQVEAAARPGRPAEGALSTVLTLGELCWVGLAGVLTDLTGSMVAETRQSKTGKEPGRG